MAKVSWKEAAEDDLEEIIDYILEDNPVAAVELLEEIQARVSDLMKFPQMYTPGRVPGTRELTVRGHFIVVHTDDPDMVHILRVVHSSQNWSL